MVHVKRVSVELWSDTNLERLVMCGRAEGEGGLAQGGVLAQAELQGGGLMDCFLSAARRSRTLPPLLLLVPLPRPARPACGGNIFCWVCGRGWVLARPRVRRRPVPPGSCAPTRTRPAAASVPAAVPTQTPWLVTAAAAAVLHEELCMGPPPPWGHPAAPPPYPHTPVPAQPFSPPARPSPGLWWQHQPPSPATHQPLTSTLNTEHWPCLRQHTPHLAGCTKECMAHITFCCCLKTFQGPSSVSTKCLKHQTP
ncbi:hypothetical protein E2C01_018450 [Portunus trituberculatus]|uniref:Uncharacterized protein n=1 Tax=Portunus trituberculatus TaxID=210409 RepID=A0A5B7DX16_PORTR|nr:hypothetical protein [Portunus trituberculatus]